MQQFFISFVNLKKNSEKVKDPGIADAFNNFFLTITENSYLHQAGKQDAITLLKDSFPENSL
jgi:hypothetical protein